MPQAVVADLREGGRWSRRQRVKNDVVYVLVRAAVAVVRITPRWAIAGLCSLLGLVAYAALGRERRAARARLARGLGRPIREREVLRVFLGAGSVLADTLALLDPREDARRTLVMDDEARAVLRAAVDERRGVVFVTAHLGPWERMAAVLVAEGFSIAAVARESYDPRLTALYDAVRVPRGVRPIYRGRPDAGRAVLRELATGATVGFLVDIPARVPSVDVTLFGTVGRVPLGPARIALARRSAVIVGTPEPCGPGHAGYRLRLRRVPIDDLGRGRHAAVRLTERLARELGDRIAGAPSRWLGAFVPVSRRPRA